MDKYINIKTAIIIAFSMLFTNKLTAQRLFYGDSVLSTATNRWVGKSTLFYDIIKNKVDSCYRVQHLTKNTVDEWGRDITDSFVLDTIYIDAPVKNGKVEGRVIFYRGDEKKIVQTIEYKEGKAEGKAFITNKSDTIFSCYYKNGLKEGLEIFNFSTLPSYTHTYFSKGKEEGLAIKYFKSSNKVWAAYHYRDGKLDGLYAEYHDKNGLLANYTWYSKGKALAGKYPSIDEQGRIWRVKEYNANGCLLKITDYDEQGNISSESPYRCK